ncbi:helix-turn-helix transcriptional regulator [Anaerofustis sp.]|uniref:helix-turn-helix domain-containing protein n=1 Tax=Anaerofustis sp. TaxID=1872517 RepID=UPI0025B8B7EE|nr:helix-turn-helix transcriptional regulator [Anaerofustis sp.]
MKSYKKIRARLLEIGGNLDTLSKSIGKSRSYVNQRINAYRYWSEEDIYKILHFLDVPEENLSEFFNLKERRGN